MDPTGCLFTTRLKEKIAARYINHQRDWTVIPGLNLSYATQDTVDMSCFYTLSVALILQGRKSLAMGSMHYQYGAGQMVVTAVDVPTSFRIKASCDLPFISLSLKLDPFLLSDITASLPQPAVTPGEEPEDVLALSVADTPSELLEAFDQLLRLIDNPEERKVLLPSALRRIHYLVLTHSQSINLRQLCNPRLPSNRIAKAVAWIKQHYPEEITIEQLANIAAMAPSTFHQHFKNITTITPLQYQKRLRLHEARRLMLSQHCSATQAAYEVGYQSTQQFNREYKRLFGAPPLQDIKQLSSTNS